MVCLDLYASYVAWAALAEAWFVDLLSLVATCVWSAWKKRQLHRSIGHSTRVTCHRLVKRWAPIAAFDTCTTSMCTHLGKHDPDMKPCLGHSHNGLLS